MQDEPSLTAIQILEAIAPLSQSIFQTLLTAYQRHPEWLTEKFRNQSWHQAEFQVKLTKKIATELRQAHDADSLILKVIKLLEALMKPPFFVSSEFLELIQNFRSILNLPPEVTPVDSPPSSGTLTVHSDLDTQNLEQFAVRLGVNLPEALSLGMAAQFSSVKHWSMSGIAILLLDAENLSLDEKTEDFLKQVCQYEIQIKIAFANWQRMGKKDIQLHNRHYELIHVPPGKDSADVKMATVGSSIFVHYPNAREVLVCSSDGVMTHLCTTLQTHGLTVYLVRKQGKSLTILNIQTGKTQTYGMEEISPVLSLSQAVEHLKFLIKTEQKRTGKQWIKFSQICTLFQETYKISLSQVAASEPGKKARDIFCDRPDDFVVHQVAGDSELYITLFDCIGLKSNPLDEATSIRLNQAAVPPAALSNGFNGREELEQALERAIAAMQKKSPEMTISIGMLGSKFKELYGQNPNWIIKKLGLGASFKSFLQSSSKFTLTQSTQTGEEIIILGKHSHSAKAFTLNPGMTSASSPGMNTPADLEQYLAELLLKLTGKAIGTSIPLSSLASEFNAEYGLPITQLMKRLQIKGKLTKFLDSSQAFKLKKMGKGYQVALVSRTP